MNAMAFTLPRYLGMEHTFALAGVFELVAAASARDRLAGSARVAFTAGPELAPKQ